MRGLVFCRHLGVALQSGDMVQVEVSNATYKIVRKTHIHAVP
jgi:hypothetical protein